MRPRHRGRPQAIGVICEVEARSVARAGFLETEHGGYALFIRYGILNHVHDYWGLWTFRVSSPSPGPTGRTNLDYEFEPTTGPDLSVGSGVSERSQLCSFRSSR